MKITFKIQFLVCLLSLLKSIQSTSHTNLDDIDLRLDTVQVIFRHGIRTPSIIEAHLVNDTDPSLFEPYGGYSRLAEVGMIQMHRFGQFIKENYGEFLGRYSVEKVYARSTAYKRNIKSLKYFWAGIYLSDEPERIEDLLKNPQMTEFKFETVPQKEDVLLLSRDCDLFDDAVREVVLSAEFQKQLEKYTSTLNLVKRKTVKVSYDMYPAARARFLFNGFSAYKSLNVRLPDWYDEQVFRELEEIAAISLGAASSTLEINRMNAGPMLEEILSNVRNENRRKIYFYNGHDYNVAALARALEVDALRYPGVGGALILESFYETRNRRRRYLKVKGWSGTGNDTFALKLRKCEELCPEEKFERIVKPMIPNDTLLSNLKDSMAVYTASVAVY